MPEHSEHTHDEQESGNSQREPERDAEPPDGSPLCDKQESDGRSVAEARLVEGLDDLMALRPETTAARTEGAPLSSKTMLSGASLPCCRICRTRSATRLSTLMVDLALLICTAGDSPKKLGSVYSVPNSRAMAIRTYFQKG